MGWMNANGMSADVPAVDGETAAEKKPLILRRRLKWQMLSVRKRIGRTSAAGPKARTTGANLNIYASPTRLMPDNDLDRRGLEAESLWHDAERACEENPEREIRLARLASKWNLPAQAEQLWLRVAHDPLSRREALDSLFLIYRTNNDLPNLYLTAMRLHETSPDEPLIAAEYARLSLLLDRNRDEGRRVAKQAFDQATTEPPCAVAQALFLI